MLRDEKIRSLLVILLLLTHSIYAQVEEENIGVESTEEQEEFSFRIRAKMSMNEFLSEPDIYLHFINSQQHSALLQYINQTGEMLDLMELQALPEFSEREYRTLLRIIEFSNSSTENKQYYLRISSRCIYQSKVDTHYLGLSWAQYHQVKGKGLYGLSFGYALEQDVGEPFVFDHVMGFDQQSYFINRKWKNNELCLGNFQVYHGFGMLVGQGFSGAMGAGGISNFVQEQWAGKSNASEYNFFHGMYYRKRLGNVITSFGYSNHFLDKGNSGYHRTASEMAKRNTNLEKLVLCSIESSQRRHREVVLYLFDEVNRKHYASVGLQYFYANSILFSEFVIKQNSQALTIGMSMLIGKNSMFNLSYLHVDSAYESAWSSYTFQGFRKDLQRGVVANINFNLNNGWLLNCTYRISIKHPNIEAFNSSYMQYYSMRIDRKFRGNVSCYSIIQYQGDAESASKMLRTKSIIRLKSNEQFTRELQVYLNNSTGEFSKGIGIELAGKWKRVKGIYSIAYFDVASKLPLYYGVDLLNQGTQHIGVFANGFIQCLGFQCTMFRHYQMGISYFINEVSATNKFGIYLKRK